MYHHIFSKKSDRYIISKNYIQLYNFIVANQDCRIKVVKHPPGRLYIKSKTNFIIDFLHATNDIKRTFDLIEILIRPKCNQMTMVATLRLQNEYREYNISEKTIEKNKLYGDNQ